ncbi:MAG: sigma-70 family RNA polymerase sigma factor [Bryobacterales bacterium]|nr:sigma-70 family RNA polymerase sigma factor [Bryobacterales bacterium]
MSSAPKRLARDEIERLYQMQGPRLLSFLLRQTADASLAQDVLQETFVQMLRSPPIAMAESQLRAYLYRAAQSRLIDHYRRQTNRREVSSETREMADEQKARNPDMERAFARLAPRDRALLWLAYVEEMRHNEIAQVINVQTLSVKVLLFRARRRLEKALRRQGFAPEVAL